VSASSLYVLLLSSGDFIAGGTEEAAPAFLVACPPG